MIFSLHSTCLHRPLASLFIFCFWHSSIFFDLHFYFGGFFFLLHFYSYINISLWLRAVHTHSSHILTLGLDWDGWIMMVMIMMHEFMQFLFLFEQGSEISFFLSSFWNLLSISMSILHLFIYTMVYRKYRVG